MRHPAGSIIGNSVRVEPTLVLLYPCSLEVGDASGSLFAHSLSAPVHRRRGERRGAFNCAAGVAGQNRGRPRHDRPERMRDPSEAPTKNVKWLTNVTHPTLSVFLPDKSKNTGFAMVICPVGGHWLTKVIQLGCEYKPRRVMRIGGIDGRLRVFDII